MGYPLRCIPLSATVEFFMILSKRYEEINDIFEKNLQCYIQSINFKKIHCHSKTYPIYCIPPWLHSSKIEANDLLPNKYYKIADTTARKVSLSQRYDPLQRQ